VVHLHLHIIPIKKFILQIVSKTFSNICLIKQKKRLFKEHRSWQTLSKYYVLFVFCSSETIQVATGNQDDAEIENEPEDEKNIRLGNLTAFGSILKSELKKGDFGSYFKELQREQQEESEDDDRLKRKNKTR